MFSRLFKKKDKPRRSLFFLFLGLALSLVLVALVIEGGFIGRQSFLENTAPSDYKSALPAGWLTSDGSVVALPDLPQPTYIVGYSDGQAAAAALVAWQARDQRYAVISELRFVDQLSAADGYKDVPQLNGKAFGAPGQAVEVTLSAADDRPSLILFIARQGNGLKLVNLRDGGGDVVPAAFLSGDYNYGSDNFEIFDADTDGQPEAVWSERNFTPSAGGGGWSTSVSAYQWRNGMFEYDKELSWALTTDASMFPEPSATKP